MSDSIEPGDSVEWTSSGGKSAGRVKKKLTGPTEIKGHHVAASPDNPEFLVESEKTGAQAAHKPSALRKSAAASAKPRTAKKPAAKKSAAQKAGTAKAAAKAGQKAGSAKKKAAKKR